jgi:hypothetical protein
VGTREQGEDISILDTFTLEYCPNETEHLSIDPDLEIKVCEQSIRCPLGFGRNSLATNSQVQFDLRVLKFLKVGEHGKLDFVIESFNVLNHTNVVGLNQFYGVASSPIPVFATANKATIPRQLQFSVDFEF